MTKQLTLIAALLLAPASAFASNLVFVGDAPMRVTIDGQHFGGFTSKRVEADGVSAGNHMLEIKTFNPKFLKKKTVYNGHYKIPGRREMVLEIDGSGQLRVVESRALTAEASEPSPNTDVERVGDPGYGDQPSILHLSTEKFMTLVLVDGAAKVEQGDCSTPKACDVWDVAPGVHELDVRTGLTAKKVQFKGRIEIPGSAEVWAKISGGAIEIYNVQPRKDLPPDAVAQAPIEGGSTTTTTTTSTTVEGVPGVSAGIAVTDPDTGETVSVNAGISGMTATSGVTVTESTTTVTETRGGPIPQQPVSGFGLLELTSTDGESFTVFIDGKEVGDCNCLDGESVKIRRVEAGEHKLVIKEFVGDEVWASGRIWVEPNFHLKLGVSQHDGVEAFNRADAWAPGY